MVKKKIDARIRTLIENGVTNHHRSLFLLVGDHSRDQIVNLHYILAKSSVKQRPSILWCYKKDLGFTSHRQKRMRKMKKEIARGVRDVDEENPFELFLSSTDIRYCYYKETDKILGQTFGMLVLQDFQALTPNLLARTIETVEGGGIVVMTIKSLSSLKQLYTMTMDVHNRFRTESHTNVVGRFNERFLLSLSHCHSCLVLDDELNILPLSSHVRAIQKSLKTPIESLVNGQVKQFDSDSAKQLYELQLSMRDTQPIGSLIDQCKTFDQAKALLTFIEAISEKTLRSTVALTSARGRGKSSALGLAIASAISYGYSNIFVTAPSPENLKSLFLMILKGFDALELKEHQHYEIIQSTNPAFNKAIVRINIFQTHRQTIQYIQPEDSAKLTQAELLIIDEAAAIPLPLVKSLLGPYLVFMSSTINGYEGTGRALSMKLIKQLRQESVIAATNTTTAAQSQSLTASATATGGRTLREITLDEPIRYSVNDPIESWLNGLLCLNCQSSLPRLSGGVPHPSDCDLYFVERDTLFSGHSASEEFLHRMMALYVSSHYKNSPNDLQLMSDAPAHQLFVLLGPQSNNSGSLPDILAVIQVCLEGEISSSSVVNSLGRGDRASGDLIPWTISQQYQTPEFASLSGARIVRIATHPELMRMGYASRAMELLMAFYQNKLTSLTENADSDKKKANKSSGASSSVVDDSESGGDSVLQSEELAPRSALPPLLQSLTDITPPSLHYVGVSYGLTSSLLSFWTKQQFLPLYLRLTANNLTGEHTCIMLHVFSNDSNRSVNARQSMKKQWEREFFRDFQMRFLHLMSYQFARFDSALALQLLQEGRNATHTDAETDDNGSGSVTQWTSFRRGPITLDQLSVLMTDYDLRRLESYADNLVDYHLIIDLLPNIALLFFAQRLGSLSLSLTQQAILLGLGLQHKDVEVLSCELQLQVQQILAQFNKSMRKISTALRDLQHQQNDARQLSKQHRSSNKTEVEKITNDDDGEEDGSSLIPLSRSLDSDLHQASKAVTAKLKSNSSATSEKLLPSSLSQFAISADNSQWEKELTGDSVKRISIKTDAKRELKRHMVHENSDQRKMPKDRDADVNKRSGKKRKVKQ